MRKPKRCVVVIIMPYPLHKPKRRFTRRKILEGYKRMKKLTQAYDKMARQEIDPEKQGKIYREMYKQEEKDLFAAAAAVRSWNNELIN